MKIVSWEEVKKMLPKRNTHQDLIDAIDAICKPLKKSEKDYFYLAEFEFGEYLINKGKIAFTNPTIKSVYTNLTEIKTKDDLFYTDDPLGFIVKGNLEVFVKNRCGTEDYFVPITLINEGELFGTFGTLDKFAEIKKQPLQRDWFVVSGNLATLYTATGLHTNAGGKELLPETIEALFDGKILSPTKWISFINHYKDKNWTVQVIYFPKHIIDLILKSHSELMFKIGWKQAFPLRTVLLSDNEIANVIDKIKSQNLNYNRIFLLNTYSFILKAINGELNAFTPLLDKEHFINNAIANFKTKNKTQEAKLSFLPFIYNEIPKNGFGLLFLFALPVLNEYSVDSLASLMKDLKKINDKVSNSKYKIYEYIEAFNNQRSKTDANVKHHNVLKKDYLAKIFNLPDNTITLTSKEFSNIILIKRK